MLISMTKLHAAVLIIVSINFSTKASSDSAFVCLGDQLRLTCSTNDSALQWTLIPPGVDDSGFNVIVLGPDGVSPSELVQNDNTFHFSITSLSPLESLMLVDNVSANVNGTRVDCRSSSNGESITNIIVIEDALPNPILMINERFRAENVTVTLEWTVEPLNMSYILTVTPDSYRPPRKTENSVLQLTLSYGIMYNVTFYIATQCGQNSTQVFELHYVKCGYPLDLPADDDSVAISSYSDPALVGTNITIDCVGKDEVTGNSTSVTLNVTCMDDGRWEPDPRQGIEGCYDANTQTGTHNDHQLSTTISTLGPTCFDDGSRKNMSCMGDQSSANLIGTTVGVAVTVLIVVAVSATFVLAILLKKGTPLCKHKATSISIDEEGVANNQHGNQQENYPLSQYSLLEALPQDDDDNAHSTSTVGPSTGRGKALAYADIGAFSPKKKHHPIPSTLYSDDDKVEYAVVDFTQSSVSKKRDLELVQPEMKESHHADGLLNLDSLLIQIKPEVTPNWYKFGEAIGVDDKVLDRCTPYPPEESIVEVCDHWLRNHSGKPTWREVAEALGQINCQQLAFQIENIYETGKLPKEVNMDDGLDELFSVADTLQPPIPPKLDL